MIDTKSKSAMRASLIMRDTKTEVAIYFANGKLHGSRKESALHDHRLKVHKANLIGVYQKGCDINHVLADIDFFYREHGYDD